MIIATVVKDERARYLESALATWTRWGRVVAVDNGSTDGSLELLREHADEVHEVATPLWGREDVVRDALYRAAMEAAQDGEWVLWLDADLTVSRDPRELDEPLADAVAMRYYDLWSPTAARHDQRWQGHLGHKVWMVRRLPGWQACTFPARGIHVAPIPPTYPAMRTLIAPDTHVLVHYGYADPRDRREKYQRYLSVADQLTPAELEHARSIVADGYLLVRPPEVRFPLRRADWTSPVDATPRDRADAAS